METRNDLQRGGFFLFESTIPKSNCTLSDMHRQTWMNHSDYPLITDMPILNQVLVKSEKNLTYDPRFTSLEIREPDYRTMSESLSSKAYVEPINTGIAYGGISDVTAYGHKGNDGNSNNTETLYGGISGFGDAYGCKGTKGDSLQHNSPHNSASSSLGSSDITTCHEVDGLPGGPFFDRMTDFMFDESYLLESMPAWFSGPPQEHSVAPITAVPYLGEACGSKCVEGVENDKVSTSFAANCSSLAHNLDGVKTSSVSRKVWDSPEGSACEILVSESTCKTEKIMESNTPFSNESDNSTLQSNKRKISDIDGINAAIDKHKFAKCTSDQPSSSKSYSEIGLVHLLIAAAEAVAARNMDLASVILARLKESVSFSGTNMQRVAAYFSEGLQCYINGQTHDSAPSNLSQSDLLSAFQILHEVSPYIKFGHFSANQAILEAVEGEKHVHILDFEIMEGIQWPPLMQALALRKGGPPWLRITALCRLNDRAYGWATTQATGKRLSEFAASVNLPFTFNMVKIDDEDDFNAASVKLTKGEVFVVNCMLHLPHMPYRRVASVTSFLKAVKKMSPVIVTLVEEELGSSNGSSSAVHYLLLALHHYSAIFDSLDACLSGEAMVRMLVERIFLGSRIRTSVACLNSGLPSLSSSSSLSLSSSFTSSSSNRPVGDLSPAYNWRLLVQSLGLKPVPMSFRSITQARLLLGLYRDGFKVEEQNGWLLLGWCSRNLFAASAWS